MHAQLSLLAFTDRSEREEVSVSPGQEAQVLHFLAGRHGKMAHQLAAADFNYVDAGNLKSRDEPHMDSVQFTIKGNQLIEDWAMYQDGKITGHHSFEFKRQ